MAGVFVNGLSVAGQVYSPVQGVPGVRIFHREAIEQLCASTRENRSMTCRFSVEPRKRVLSVKFVVSTTSVSPSQWPTESPIHLRMAADAAHSSARCEHHAPFQSGSSRIPGLDDLVQVVVEIIRQSWWSGGGAETHQTAFAKRPRSGSSYAPACSSPGSLLSWRQTLVSNSSTIRFRAPAVNGGTRPSGGSITIDARLCPSTIVKGEPGSSQPPL